MPLWFSLTLCSALLLLPKQSQKVMSYGISRYFAVGVLIAMIFCGFLEQLALFPGVYLNIGGGLLPILFSFAVVFFMPVEHRNDLLACAVLGSIGTYLLCDILEDWAVVAGIDGKTVKMLISLLYALSFQKNILHGICCYTLCYQLFFVWAYLDSLWMQKPIYLAIGAHTDFSAFMAGAILVALFSFAFQWMYTKARRPEKTLQKERGEPLCQIQDDSVK